MADVRTYIKVHDGMPDHPKVDGLSDKAFRLLVESWCWCSRHLTDGRIPAATWRKRGSPKARKELLDAGLVEQADDGAFVMHDYLEHQRSAEQVKHAREAKGRGGSYGNHVRWHEQRRLVDPGCEHCPTPPADDGLDDEPAPGPLLNGSHMRSDIRSHSDRKTSPETYRETDRSPTGIGEGSLDRHLQLVDARARTTSDEDSKIDEQIAAALSQLLGRRISLEHAAATRERILRGRAVDRPLPYVLKAIRAAPENFRPSDEHPSSRTVAEALRAARGEA
jgi:hypothetical protein